MFCAFNQTRLFITLKATGGVLRMHLGELIATQIQKTYLLTMSAFGNNVKKRKNCKNVLNCERCVHPPFTNRRCGAATAVWRSTASVKGRAATLSSSWRRCSVREAGTPRAVPLCSSTAVGCIRRWSLMVAPWKTSHRRTGATRCWTRHSRRETWRPVSLVLASGWHPKNIRHSRWFWTQICAFSYQTKSSCLNTESYRSKRSCQNKHSKSTRIKTYPSL